MSDTPSQQEIRKMLADATVGIIGLGGLGSHIAWMLLRAGVRTLVLADHDQVSEDNLSRQDYYPDQIGMSKTEALAEQLRRIDCDAHIVLIEERIIPDTLPRYFEPVDVLVEAVDSAKDKADLIAGATRYLPNTPLVGASGIAGIGPTDEIETLHLTDRVWIVGDLASNADAGLPLLCSRVVYAAAKQAHLVIRILLGAEKV